MEGEPMTQMPKRIQRKRTKGWRMPAGCIYVGRPTVFGNPYKTADEFRTLIEAIIGFSGQSEFHKTTLREFSHVYYMVGRLEELRNKDLCCWCKLCDAHRDGKPFDVECPDCDPCHADPLGEIANR